jgi:hypothetical protein
VDQFISNADAAEKFTLQIVTDMIESQEIETQLHAFNLLFNLSIHFNLSDETNFLDDKKRKKKNHIYLIT